MVNQNKDKFHRLQEKHQAEYVGSDRNQPPGIKDKDYNGQGNTDKSPGATGRKI